MQIFQGVNIYNKEYIITEKYTKANYILFITLGVSLNKPSFIGKSSSRLLSLSLYLLSFISSSIKPKNQVLEYISMGALKFYFFGVLKEADVFRYPIDKKRLRKIDQKN